MTPLTSTFNDHLKDAVRYVLPEVVLVAAACVLFLLACVRAGRAVSFLFALAGVVAAGLVAWYLPDCVVPVEPGAKATFDPTLSPIDPTGAASFVRWLSIIAAAVYLCLGWTDSKSAAPEYFGCWLVVAAGVSLVARSNDLVTLFLSLEMVSIPTYVLLYLPAVDKNGQESAMKYFMLSVLSSGILLFGFSYLYGVTGSTNLPAIISALKPDGSHGSQPLLAVVGGVMVLGGLGFRVAAVPFHFYAPDVYEGGPTGVVAQLAFIPKVAGVVALGRVFGLLTAHAAGPELPFGVSNSLLPLSLWVIAVITMCFGNLLAIIQDNVKRLLAYSGIAHTGYMIIGVLVASTAPGDGASRSGMDAVLFYLVAYGLMTVGVFAVIAHVESRDRPVESVDDLAGLGRTHPLAAAAMGVFLFSLIGLPLTAGFIGKFNLFIAAFEVPTTTNMKGMYQILAVVAVVNAAVSAVYYLRAVGVMYLRAPLKPATPNRGRPQLLVAVLCALGTLALGCYPQPLLDLASKAAPLPKDRPVGYVVTK